MAQDADEEAVVTGFTGTLVSEGDLSFLPGPNKKGYGPYRFSMDVSEWVIQQCAYVTTVDNRDQTCHAVRVADRWTPSSPGLYRYREEPQCRWTSRSPTVS
jgi:hypothetical protein